MTEIDRRIQEINLTKVAVYDLLIRQKELNDILMADEGRKQELINKINELEREVTELKKMNFNEVENV